MNNNRGRIFAGSLIFSILLHGAVLFFLKVEKAPAGQSEPEKITVSLRRFEQVQKPEPVIEKVQKPEPVVKKEQPKSVRKPLPVREKPSAVKTVEEPVTEEKAETAQTAPAEAVTLIAAVSVPKPAAEKPAMPPQPEFDFDGFKARLTDGIGRNKKYPYAARRRGYEGTVLLKLNIDCEGRLQGLKMVESSGFDVLDSEALSLASSVFPIREKLPEPVTLLIPISYSLHN
ncbi:energy transducer TonB [Geovibrio thiophilus]|uniref:Energy transducer TonB n=1 Tax=Geovibrio thiophilus TaxID=139438 RepID=A0A3R5XXW7_9BACT|nr:energy transducer TonB [Geovibrio thiophilus]QAR33428.1 energy transducer TonB [Geovibrio thiophilus]